MHRLTANCNPAVGVNGCHYVALQQTVGFVHSGTLPQLRSKAPVRPQPRVQDQHGEGEKIKIKENKSINATLTGNFWSSDPSLEGVLSRKQNVSLTKSSFITLITPHAVQNVAVAHQASFYSALATSVRSVSSGHCPSRLFPLV